MSKNKREVKIKYDKQSMMILKWSLLISLFLLGLSCLIGYFEIGGLEILFVFTLYIGTGVSIVSVIALFCGSCYFHRLEKYGYIIPEKKKDYDGLLVNLPKKPKKSTEVVKQVSLFGVHSIILAFVCLGCYVLFMVINVVYYVEWISIKSTAGTMFGLQAFFLGIWILSFLICFFQKNPKKYRDDVEIDCTRKERMSIEQGLIGILVLALLSGFGALTVRSMTNYVFQSMIERDYYNIKIVRSVVKDTLETYTDANGQINTTGWEETYQQLTEGVNIITWGVPTDEFQKEVANQLEVEDFDWLCSDYKLSKNDAVVIVKLENDNVIAELTNPIELVKKKGRNRTVIRSEADNERNYVY